jgi:hypothetical protein
MATVVRAANVRSAHIDTFHANATSADLHLWSASLNDTRVMIEYLDTDSTGQSKLCHMPLRRDAQGTWWINNPTEPRWTRVPGSGLGPVLAGVWARRDPGTPVRVLRVGEANQSEPRTRADDAASLVRFYEALHGQGTSNVQAGRSRIHNEWQRRTESNGDFIDRFVGVLRAAKWSVASAKNIMSNFLIYIQNNANMMRFDDLNEQTLNTWIERFLTRPAGSKSRKVPAEAAGNSLYRSNERSCLNRLAELMQYGSVLPRGVVTRGMGNQEASSSS